MFVSPTVRPLLIAGLVVAEVGLWQWRMVIAYRGKRALAMALGALGAILQITAISQVVSYVNDPISVGAYAVGVGLGILLGLVAGDRFNPGAVGVTIVTGSPAAAARLWDLGWPATAHTGVGQDGPVTVLSVAIDRRDEARLHRDVARVAPGAFWSTAEANQPTSALQS
jgi:uncharacterized protein YebE (UPF0316 family)